MNEILNVHVRFENNILVTDSRNVAEVFGKRHDNVLRDIEIIRKHLLTFEDMFFESTMPDSYGREQKVYLMNRDGFTLLAMGFTGKDALQWKMKYIEAFNKMEAALNSPEYIMARALKMADQTIAKLKDENSSLLNDVKRMKPKEVFADSVAISDSTILIGELAKILKGNGIDIGQHRLFQWMRDNGYLISRKGSDRNMPTQKSMDLGLFKIKETTINNPDGSVRINKTTKVTGKGQQYFINKFIAICPDDIGYSDSERTMQLVLEGGTQ